MNDYLILALILFVYMSLWFIVSLLKRRNDVADVAWGLGFVLLAWSAFVLSDGPGVRGLLVNVLVSIWGVRLAWHIHSRNRGRMEDYRYLAWRTEWGKWFYVRSYAQVYLLQGFLLFLVVSPVLLINGSVAMGLGMLDALGMAVWLVGFSFEAVGDAQLARFIKDPTNKGKLMQGGLWAYTRHPNYFGEVAQWWGLWLVALSVPGGWLGIIGPVTITFLILKVSGVPMLERKMREHPEFAAYERRVSMFIPLPPRNISET
ncbi:MAG: Steroid 5-alpha reductase [Patescibacteria group bacterium]|nr:Steroid 5-alpha reductase [Patescibacteria group bacterium]